MKSITDQEFESLVKHEKWTHKTITEIDVSEFEMNDQIWNTAKIDVISICSKNKIIYSTIYTYKVFDSYSIKKDYNTICTIEDLKGNEIQYKSEYDIYHFVDDELPEIFKEPDLTKLEIYLDRMDVKT